MEIGQAPSTSDSPNCLRFVRSVNNNRAEGVSVQSSLMIGGRQSAGLPRSVVACSREIRQALEQGATEGGGNEAQEGRVRPGHGALPTVDTPQLGLFQWMGQALG